MGRPAKHPEPPIEKMRRGQIWQVALLERRRRQEVLLGEPLQQFIKFLVLIIDPKDHGWPDNKYRWWHSRLFLGDLQKRDEDAILDDFKRLAQQDPPYINNYCRVKKVYRGDYSYWEPLGTLAEKRI